MKKLALTFPGGQGSISDPVETKYTSIGDIFTALLPYVLTLAGILLFIYFIWGGFEILVSTADPQRMKQGRERILHATVGFIILFISWWMMRVIEIIFGIQILT